ncbi:DUF1642 domain-containing protein [Pediococcus acidilactici]|uniref:DUF1642 domain-containing protein n=1 Tax=Pediococcus acidilactici TaxID=1254 RepID=UPI00132F8E52|nr:DUF1642 domain-containing protein [Pediococcus acidilactici]KAF0387765.1 DUF1642 domain-containing protein [Pediococcus acidilactici]KAF0802265.1 DUF1642 domain-containing protein [Pediococcus acidilactici]
MDIDEVKKELTENMEGANADYTNYPENGEYPQGYASGCEYAIELLENLQEKKVVIPEFVAHWIEEAKEHYGNEIDPLKIVYWIGDYIGNIDPHYEWLENIYNQKLLLNAAINGYEVKKEPKYRIKLPGLAGNNGQQYISKSADGKLFACARRDYLQQEFTNDELKQLPDWIRRIELEEFKDD